MPSQIDVFYDEESHYAQLTEKLKQESINLIPLSDQLYSMGDVSKLPSTYKQLAPDGDVIGLRTRFDNQAAIGSFSVDDLTEIMKMNMDTVKHSNFDQLTKQYSDEVRQFCEDLIQCIKLREKYQALSSQRSCDNPLYADSWKSYPPPQPKGWHFEDEFGSINYYQSADSVPHYSGENFDLNDYTENVLKPFVKRLKAEMKLTVGKHIEIEGFNQPELPSFNEFLDDLNFIVDTSIDKTGVMLSMRRLEYLKEKFESYILLNEHQETLKTKLNPHRDFYNCRKIDNNIGLSMCMTKKHLLNVINLKLREEPDRIVYDDKKGNRFTLEQLFQPYFDSNNSRRLNVDDLFEFGLIDRNFGSVDDSSGLNIDNDTDYEAIIKNEILSRIEHTFLRIENSIGGEYLSTILKQVLSDYEKSKYQFGEIGINFNLLDTYREGQGKWESLADWIIDNKLVSYNVKWIIRIPRNYSILKEQGQVSSFQDFLNQIFKPLFEVSINPLKNPKLHYFLTKISGFDLLSVDKRHRDESLFDIPKLQSPRKWTSDENPPYSYYLYYIFKNFSKLNNFRKSRSMCTFNLRPHVASLSDRSGLGIITESLSSCFLLSKNIINGEKLANYPVLQYLYYLKQIGITMSPLCWNKTLQLSNDDDNHIESNTFAYEKNPAIEFFQIGMRVSLSTNKPLFSSLTREPLIEEYSVAGSMHKLSGVDLCELCRNSVLISEFNGDLKRHWIGVKYVDHDEDSENKQDWKFSDDFGIQRCNVPNMRLDYRIDSLNLEHKFIEQLQYRTQE